MTLTPKIIEMVLRLVHHGEHCGARPILGGYGFCEHCGVTAPEWEQHNGEVQQALNEARRAEAR